MKNGESVLATPRQSAFTIVELLIVIVVIAILAAITLISYNGIQQRAKASSAQSLLSQTVNKVKLYAIDHSDQYPSSLTDAGIIDTTNLQYSSTSSTYCITATAQNVSYYQNTTTNTPTKGACPGHGVDGGGVVTNLASNPRATKLSIPTGQFGWKTRWAGYGGSQTESLVAGASDGPLSNVTTYARKQWTVIGGQLQDIAYDFGSGSVQPGDVYTITAYWRVSRSAVATSARIIIQWYDASGSLLSSTNGNDTSLQIAADTWYRPSITATVPTGAVSMKPYISLWLSSNTSLSVGDTLDGTALMITKGSTVYDYADPTTNLSWAWNGTPNNSTSSGPTP